MWRLIARDGVPRRPRSPHLQHETVGRGERLRLREAQARVNSAGKIRRVVSSDCGSSGILRHRLPCRTCCLLLGFLLGTTDTDTQGFATDENGGREFLVVIGSGGGDLVNGNSGTVFCGQFLQTRLPSRPAPRSGARVSRSSNRSRTTRRAVSMPCCRWMAPRIDSIPSARMDGCHGRPSFPRPYPAAGVLRVHLHPESWQPRRVHAC